MDGCANGHAVRGGISERGAVVGGAFEKGVGEVFFVCSFRCRFAFRPFVLYLCSGKGSAGALPFFRFPSP